MTSTQVAFRSGVERFRVAASADAVAAASLGAVVVGLAIATWGTWGDLDSDTGYDAVAAARLADGEVPYRDFIYYYGPLAPAFIGLLTLIGGAGFGPTILFGFVITISLIAGTYLLARAFVGPGGAFLASVITTAVAFVPNNYGYVIPHTHAATLGTLSVVGFLLAAFRFLDRGEMWWVAVAGACAGLAFLTKPEAAAAVVVAGVVWLALRLRGGSPKREALALGIPLVGVPVVVYGALLTGVSAQVLLFENLYPRDALAAGGNELVRVRMPMSLASLAELAFRSALYLAGVVVLAGAALVLARVGRRRNVLIAVLALLAAVVVAACVARPEALRHGLQFVYAWIPAGAAAVSLLILVRGSRKRGEWTNDEQKAALAVTALAVMAATTYGAFYLHAPHPQMAAYYAPLAAVFIARLHLREFAPGRSGRALGAAWLTFLALAGLGLTVHDARAESVVVTGPGGDLRETPVEARLYQRALDEIQRRARPGDSIFVAPLMTNLRVLSGHDNPLPEISMIPGALPTEAAQRDAISHLDAAGVRLVVTDDRSWPGYGHTRFGESFGRAIAEWIRRDFTLVTTITAPAHETVEGTQPERNVFVWLRRGS